MSYTWTRATNDQVISTKPCFISNVVVTPTSASKRVDCTLYDGESAQDPEITSILGGTGETKVVHFSPALETQRGLYLDYGGDTQEVLIQFCWKDE